jgi:hypothetical protein
LLARLLATAALWVRIQTFLKNNKMRDISKGVAKTFYPAKKSYKKCIQKTENKNLVAWSLWTSNFCGLKEYIFEVYQETNCLKFNEFEQ